MVIRDLIILCNFRFCAFVLFCRSYYDFRFLIWYLQILSKIYFDGLSVILTSILFS